MKIKAILIIEILFFSIVNIFGQSDTKAIIQYMEGDISISRNGQYLDYSEIDMGTEIENYDLIETEDGYLEIELRTPVSSSVIIKMHENTSFYFDTKEINGKRKTSFQLLTGSLGMKVNKLYEDNELNINVNDSVMGVRGTEFTIQSNIDGSTLVSTTEGKVSCKNEEGSEWFSIPGIVCETDGDKKYKEIVVPPEELDDYKQKWANRRMDILRSNALGSIRHYAKLYNQLYPRFDRAWESLEKKDMVFKNWTRQMSSESRPSLSDAVKSKQTISREIIELRAILPMFQQTFYVLNELEKLHRQGFGKGKLDINMNQNQLFNHITSKRMETKRRLVKSLFYFRVFLSMGKRINGSELNNEGLLDNLMSGSNMLMGGPPETNSPF